MERLTATQQASSEGESGFEEDSEPDIVPPKASDPVISLATASKPEAQPRRAAETSQAEEQTAAESQRQPLAPVPKAIPLVTTQYSLKSDMLFG